MEFPGQNKRQGRKNNLFESELTQSQPILLRIYPLSRNAVPLDVIIKFEVGRRLTIVAILFANRPIARTEKFFFNKSLIMSASIEDGFVTLAEAINSQRQ